MAAPVVLVSAGFPPYDDYMGIAYARPLEAVGALPLHLPYLEDVDAAVELADAVLLGFGGDIDPARYGGGSHPTLTAISQRRDAFELALARRALDAGLPLLGICRGMQLLNVACGGTLIADAAPHPGGDWERWDRVRLAVAADEPVDPHPGHPLRVAPGSRLAAALGTTESWVNSYHHQAVDRLGDGVRAVGWADDGIVEAIELEGPVWALGAQWELQESWKDDARFLGVFREFVAAARGVSATAGRASPPAAA